MVLPAIAFLPIILAAVIIFALFILAFSFFKSTIVAIALGIFGAFLLIKLIPEYNKKQNRIAILIAGAIIILALFIGVFQPFSVVVMP